MSRVPIGALHPVILLASSDPLVTMTPALSVPIIMEISGYAMVHKRARRGGLLAIVRLSLMHKSD